MNISSARWKPLDYQPKTSRFDRAVKRYHDASKTEDGKEKTASKVARIVVSVFLSLLIVTIPSVIMFNVRVFHLQQVDKFYKEAANKIPPKISMPIEMKTKTQSFNHAAGYVIHDETIWMKNHQKVDWKPMYFDGWPKRKPLELHVDGANLIVIDDKRGVHYKKVIKEKFDRDENVYRMYDKSTKDNWKDRWFTLPVINRIVNLFTGSRLHLPEFTKAWAVGHRGQFNHYIQDRDGIPHMVKEGVTTLYVLDKSGQYIYLFDPWKPKNVLVRIPIPGMAQDSFVAENISVSASTIMIIGYRYEKQEKGEYIKKPEVRTMLCDIDSLGWNPVLRYSYFKNEKKARILPTEPSGWKVHSLPLSEGDELSRHAAIVQTGEGNASREMRILTKRGDALTLWRKSLNDDGWKQVPYNNEIDFEKMETVEKAPKPIVKNFEAILEDYNCITLDHFNNECILGKLQVANVELLLHRRENLIQKILSFGRNFYHYDLVLQEDQKNLPVLFQAFFKKNRVIPVKVAASDDGKILRIRDRRLFGSGLDLKLNEAGEN